MKSVKVNSQSLWAYLQLTRPANIITAWADILAGIAASGYLTITQDPPPWNFIPPVWLLIATTGLYGGGVVLNDLFDMEIDLLERPERPIPGGTASPQVAALLGGWLLSVGIVAASQVSFFSGGLALTIAAAALFYNAFGKHYTILAPINMGLCRGGNLLLGVSITPAIVGEYWFLALIPIVYIAAITLLSREEVHEAHLTTAVMALLMIVMVILGLLTLGLFTNYHLLTALPFLIFFMIQILSPLINALQQPTPEYMRLAVKSGVISVIILDSCLVAGFAGWICGLLVLSLLLISTKLSQIFAVT
jgi:4-hydroxybenzoate polyprenyltransferase